MNKSDLIEALAPRLGGRAAATTALETLVDVVLREVAGGGHVGITGFGTFEQVDRAPRTGRNPRTGQAVPIAGTATPRFRPGTYFKDVVADPTTLPEDGLAGIRGGGEREAGPSATPSAGAPATVRRSGPARATRGQAAPATPDAAPRPATGTPATVRKNSDASTTSTQADAAGSTSADAAPAEADAVANGRVMRGGEDITAGMIVAKKAQLARVKNDEIAAKAKSTKKSAKKSAKADQGSEPKKKAKKAKKSGSKKADGKKQGAKKTSSKGS